MDKPIKKICIKENFVPYGTRNLDSKDRISLGGKVRKQLAAKLKVDGFEVMFGDEGDILLRPVTTVNSQDAWFWSKGWQEGEREAEEDLKHGRVKKFINVHELIKELDK